MKIGDKVKVAENKYTILRRINGKTLKLIEAYVFEPKNPHYAHDGYGCVWVEREDGWFVPLNRNDIVPPDNA